MNIFWIIGFTCPTRSPHETCTAGSGGTPVYVARRVCVQPILNVYLPNCFFQCTGLLALVQKHVHHLACRDSGAHWKWSQWRTLDSASSLSWFLYLSVSTCTASTDPFLLGTTDSDCKFGDCVCEAADDVLQCIQYNAHMSEHEQEWTWYATEIVYCLG